MSTGIWILVLFLSDILLNFGVDSMKKSPDQSCSTSVVGQSSNNLQVENEVPGGKKKILLLADAFLDHYTFAYFIAVKYKINGVKKVLDKPGEGVHFIEIISEEENVPVIKTDWKKEYLNNHDMYDELIKLADFYTFSFFKAILKNNSVTIEGKQLGIFDWLKENVKQFALGISEFSIMSGAFFLFNEIGLEKYIATNSSTPYPVYLYFLDIFFARECMNSYNNVFNLATNEGVYRFSINTFKELYQTSKLAEYTKLKEDYNLRVKKMPKIEDLLRKSKYYLINVHPLGRYFVREDEENDQAKCLVIFNMGTAVGYEGFSREHMKVLIDTFEKYNECKYIVENGTFEINDYYNMNTKKENILLYYNGNGIIDKQEILSYTNVVCYITDGGQKSFNEALYAGVPLLVIPFFGEQYFNATLTKYMQIGITMNYEKFVNEFLEKFKEIMKQNIAKAIHSSPSTQIAKFLKTVEKAINDENEEFSPISTDKKLFLKLLEFHSNELEVHSKFSLDAPCATHCKFTI
uniref:glucuronosyltransferase n=1 Tax=Meloidogyne floridensis TaxID=298350 RepID=A0A915NN79_9BILA